MSRYAAIILAAGRGSRFAAAGGPEASKLVALHGGEPLVTRVGRAALASAATPVIVVTGHARPDVEASLAALNVQFVHNARYGEGLSTSLLCGLQAVPFDAAGMLVLLGDMPEIEPVTIDALIQRAAKRPHVDAVVPEHNGEAGNPVLLSRSLFPRLRSLTGDQGARQLLKHAGVTVARIEQPACILLDIDRPEDLQRIF